MMMTCWIYGAMASHCHTAILLYVFLCNLSRCEPSFGYVISMEPNFYYHYEHLVWMLEYIEYPEFNDVSVMKLFMIKSYHCYNHRGLAMLFPNICYHTCSINEEKLEYS
jgi:hypothetical protein